MLVALLIPAVNFARESGRRAQCLNNVRSVGQALLQHETDKGAFPNRVAQLRVMSGNQVNEISVSWMTKLLPYLEKGNVLEQIQSGTLMGPVELEIATCPSDPPVGDIPFRLSYVVNCGIWDRDFGEEPAEWALDRAANGVSHVGVGRSPVTVNLGYLAKNDGASNTLLVSENLNAVAWMSVPGPLQGIELEEGLHGMVWTTQTTKWLTDQESPTADRQFAINSRRTRSVLDSDLLTLDANSWVSFARPSSNHSGGVNAVFCDTHAQFLEEDIDPWVYAQLMSVSNTQAHHPRMGMDWRQLPVPAQVNFQLSDAAF